ncbi:MAG: GGDEF domain-containing protein [Spirochaetae bacterium HGW-Spirochaetae-5]|nr:MAG: GGDEF domain-containing protein [Spirochaetae bacterium HGW-Spirochaetae-5]
MEGTVDLSKKTYLTAVLFMLSFIVIFLLSLWIFLINDYIIIQNIEEIRKSWIIGAVLVLTFASGFSVIFLLILRKNIISPINILTKRAMEIQSTCDFTSRLPIRTDDEISRLAWTFNALLDRMAELNYSLEKKIENNSIMLERSIKERISELMTMNQVLTLMEEVFEHSLEGIIITDSNSIINKVNPAFTKITGYAENEVIGKNPRILKSDHHNPHFYKSMWESLITNGHWTGEIWNRHKDGYSFPEWMSIIAIRNSEGETTHYVGVFHDISDMKRQEELIRYQAFHDALTGLPNRFLLKNRMEQSILHSTRDKNRFGVIFLDLDNFKKINDSLGLMIGDLLLKETSERLRQVARNVDTVARHGGDEFIILVENIEDEKPLITLAQRIIAAFKEPFKILDHSFHIGVTLGIAVFPEDGKETDILLRNADTAMFRAKEEGKETFTMYTTSLNDSVTRNLKLENDLRKALVEKSFEVHYQPQMDLKSEKIVSAEGLVRWKNLEGIMMHPDRFIPFSEKNGLIFEIDRIVMDKAFQEISGLINAGMFPFKLALNCSARILHLKKMPEIIAASLEAFNLSPEWFELEITETAIMKNYGESLDVIFRLKEIGISISLDDFGTGYSSLGQLKNLPIDSLKIDRSFVEEISKNRDNGHIIEAIVSLSQKFGVKVIAEGVETEDQLSFLKTAGCDIAQGYLISKPLPFNELKTFLGVG